MEKYVLCYYILLFLFIILTKFYFNYRKALKNGDILISKWAMPLSIIDIALFVVMVYIMGDAIGSRLNKGYSFAAMYALCIIVMTIFNSKLLVTDKGIYFMSQFTSWEKIDEIILESDSMVNVRRRAFLSGGYKIRNFSYDDKFISIVEEKCVVRK